jgi:hypothetical protein
LAAESDARTSGEGDEGRFDALHQELESFLVGGPRFPRVEGVRDISQGVGMRDGEHCAVENFSGRRQDGCDGLLGFFLVVKEGEEWRWRGALGWAGRTRRGRGGSRGFNARVVQGDDAVCKLVLSVGGQHDFDNFCE